MKTLLDLMGGDKDERPNSGDNNTVETALEDDTSQSGFEAAAQDCFHALKHGDESGFRDALQAAIEIAR